MKYGLKVELGYAMMFGAILGALLGLLIGMIFSPNHLYEATAIGAIILGSANVVCAYTWYRKEERLEKERDL